MKRALIVKDAKATVFYRDTAIEIVSMYGNQLIGYRHIYGVYLHQDIAVNIKTVLQIGKKVPVHFIDKKGTLLAKVSFQV